MCLDEDVIKATGDSNVQCRGCLVCSVRYYSGFRGEGQHEAAVPDEFMKNLSATVACTVGFPRPMLGFKVPDDEALCSVSQYSQKIRYQGLGWGSWWSVNTADG
ncbi:hypothetical protein TNCT_335811 [Trichonephila clavata]|uniref:Uncharacterized protein n=1 Tax=Trichonephila clavata TaxID=2740835 RepID=A0A8X6LU69_TRICU|nr:hypothetical protein TNCT_335811 [Trichonephila clavata]